MNIKELFKNISDGFKKFFKVENIEKIIGFLSFEAISFYFSLSMYLALGVTFQAKIAMGTATVAVEAFKVMLITAMSGSSYAMSFYNKRFKQGKEYFGVYLKHLKSFFFAFLFYFITAGVSFLATVGFGLATVHQYNQVNQIVDNSAATKTFQDQIVRLQQQVVGHETLNASDKSSADEFAATAATFLDMTDRTQRSNKNYYIGEAEKRLKKIEGRNTLIEGLNGQIAIIEAQIIELEKQVSEDGKESTKSIFQLMEDSIDGKLTSSNIMLIIVVLLALVIEVGLVYTSPKIEKIDEEKDFEMYPNHKSIKKRKYRKQENEIDDDDQDYIETEEPVEIKTNIQASELKPVVEKKFEAIEVPEPMIEVIKTPEPIVEIIEVPEPMVEVIKTPEPIVEVIKVPEPMVEKTEVLEPMVEVIEAPEPIVEVIKTPEPIIEKEVSKPEQKVKVIDIKAKEKRLAEAKKEVEAKIKENLVDVEKDKENKQNKQLLYVVDKLFNNTAKGENLISLNELSKSISIPKDKLEKVCRYLSYIGVVSYDMSNRTWKPKMDKEEAMEVVKQKLTKSKT